MNWIVEVGTDFWTMIAAIAAFSTSVFVFLQVRVMRKSAQAQAAYVLFQRLQEDDVRSARGKAIELARSGNWEWSKDQKETVARACNEFDIAGILARYGHVQERFIVDNWGEGIKELWPAGRHLICLERDKRNIDLYPDFERLAMRSEKHSKHRSRLFKKRKILYHQWKIDQNRIRKEKNREQAS